jgi:hypothetical protein
MEPTVAADRARLRDALIRRHVVIAPRQPRVGNQCDLNASRDETRVFLIANVFDEIFKVLRQAFTLLIYGFTP